MAALLSVAWALLAWKVLIPLSYPAGPRESHFIERYAHLGDSYLSIAVAVLTRPGFVLERIFSGEMARMFLSLGLLPLLSPLSVLLAFPTVLLHLISGYEFQARLGVYYGLNALTVLMLGVPGALARLKRWTRPSVAAVFAAVAVAAGATAPFPFRPTQVDRRGRALAAALPVEAGISAQASFLPHLAPSRQTRMYPKLEGASLIVLDLGRDGWPLNSEQYRAQVSALLADRGWGVEQVEAQRFLVLRRGASRERLDEARRAVAGALRR